MKTDAIPVLVDLLDRAFHRRSWHGPNLRGSIRGVAPAVAAWRPHPGRRNIWEHVVHAAYWKYTVRRRLLGEKRGSFPLEGNNWFVRPLEATASAWKDDVALLEAMHRELRSAIANLSASNLNSLLPASKVTYLELIGGITAHDVYHAGQIQLLKRLATADAASDGE